MARSSAFWRIWVVAGTVGGILFAPSAIAELPCGYEVSAIIRGPFCDLFGYPPTIPSDLSEDGEVVGFYYACTAGPPKPFRWSEDSGFVTLSLPPGFSEGAAAGIDDQTGWIAGGITPQGANLSTAAVWMKGIPIDIGTLPGGNYSRTAAIANGRVVGTWGNTTGNPGLQAFLWQDDQMIDLAPDLGTVRAEARDVNPSGQVVGWMGQTFSDARGFIWEGGQVTDLGPIPGGFTSEAWAINNAGEVCGSGRINDPDTAEVRSRALFWRNGKITNLGTLPGLPHSAAFDLNDGSLVVGTALGSGAGQCAIIWHDSVMVDLNTLISPEPDVDIQIAYSINNDGLIACRATHQNDVVGIVLRPIESPPGDVTCDGSVSREDLTILFDAWGECPPLEACPADIDRDGYVNVIDLLIMLANWG